MCLCAHACMHLCCVHSVCLRASTVCVSMCACVTCTHVYSICAFLPDYTLRLSPCLSVSAQRSLKQAWLSPREASGYNTHTRLHVQSINQRGPSSVCGHLDVLLSRGGCPDPCPGMVRRRRRRCMNINKETGCLCVSQHTADASCPT